MVCSILLLVSTARGLNKGVIVITPVHHKVGIRLRVSAGLTSLLYRPLTANALENSPSYGLIRQIYFP